jgi:hypothetical protein
MVYHSFLLNPRAWLSDCIRYGKLNFWATGMPWKEVDPAINNHTFEYNPGDNARKIWELSTKLPWNCLEEPSSMTITCAKCSSNLKAPWTTCTTSAHFNASAPGDGDYGYADAGFAVTCGCGHKIGHDSLRCAKFMSDLDKLLKQDIPMPGCYLGINGLVLP